MLGHAQSAVPPFSRPSASEAQIRAGTDLVVRDSLLTLSGWTAFIVGINTLADAIFQMPMPAANRRLPDVSNA